MQILRRNDKKAETVVQKRAFERRPVSISVRLFLGNMFYAGKILDISEMGMFIQTRLCPPPKAMFIILVQNEKNLLQFFARVRWVKKANGVFDGVGAEILFPASNCLRSVSSKKYSQPVK
jgi:hypothetical protein